MMIFIKDVLTVEEKSKSESNGLPVYKKPNDINRGRMISRAGCKRKPSLRGLLNISKGRKLGKCKRVRSRGGGTENLRENGNA